MTVSLIIGPTWARLGIPNWNPLQHLPNIIAPTRLHPNELIDAYASTNKWKTLQVPTQNLYGTAGLGLSNEIEIVISLQEIHPME